MFIVVMPSPHARCGGLSTETVQSRASVILIDEYAGVLERYVDEDGLVHYAGLKADRRGLDAFIESLAVLDPSVLEGDGDEDKVAFWVNAYNALTLIAIIDRYPLAVSDTDYPANSIRQIPGVWDDLKFPVAGRSLSLNQIEHDILRARFEEPRIHVALVCASIGCPFLRREPYTGADLDAQLDDQTRRFLRHPRNFRIDREAEVLYLSTIFEWFAEDFGTVVTFVSRYVGEAEREYLLEATYEIAYLPYDWTLNDQAVAGE
jgi:hypothetical protein